MVELTEQCPNVKIRGGLRRLLTPLSSTKSMGLRSNGISSQSIAFSKMRYTRLRIWPLVFWGQWQFSEPILNRIWFGRRYRT